MQGDADIDEAKHEPLRHAAVKPARGKERDREQREQQDRDDRGARVDLLLSDADPDDHPHGGQTDHQHQDVPDAPAHGQSKRYRDHADACDDAEHPLPQADPVIGDDLKPFF